MVVQGSGRTDAGVHALAQVAHADVPERERYSLERWTLALNSYLPPEVRVLAVRHAPLGFHAQYSAAGKIYRYRLWNAAILDPFENGRAWHLPGILDDVAIIENAQLLVGKHDFGPFSANRGKPDESTVRTIRSVIVRRRGKLLTFEYEGNGFLYKMVRLLTGSLVRCGQGRTKPDWIADLLGGKAGKTSFAAPAAGLYLRRVLYSKKL